MLITLTVVDPTGSDGPVDVEVSAPGRRSPWLRAPRAAARRRA